jgi:DNA-binding response OmpR family regulator
MALRADSTVLVVEDERVVALDLRRRLLRHGYRVVATAATGADALRLAKEFIPSIVIMDLRLQGTMDGVTTAHRLRSESKFALIYLNTGHGDFSDTETTNPIAVLDKPFSESQLMAAIEIAERSLYGSDIAGLSTSPAAPIGSMKEPSSAEELAESPLKPRPHE